jgi:hypothetical protein
MYRFVNIHSLGTHKLTAGTVAVGLQAQKGGLAETSSNDELRERARANQWTPAYRLIS